MRKEFAVRFGVVAFVVALILMVVEVSWGKDVTESKPAAAPVMVEAERESVAMITETVAETEEIVIETEEIVIEEPETVAEPEKVFDVEKEGETEPETEIEEVESDSEEETEEHECDSFYPEEYTEELGWACYKHECVECGAVEYFEWVSEVDEEPEEETEHTVDSCSEFSEPDEDGYFYCLECGKQFCLDEE